MKYNFFEEKVNNAYEWFAFWGIWTLSTLIQSIFAPHNVIINGYCFHNLLWYVASIIYFIVACHYHWHYFEAYYHLHDINDMNNYTASLSRWIAERNRDLS